MTRFARSFGQPLQQGSYELGHPAGVLRVGNVRTAGWNVADPVADVLLNSGSANRTQTSRNRDRSAAALDTYQSALHRASRRLRGFVGGHPVKSVLAAAMVGAVLGRWLVSVVRRSISTMLQKS